MFGGHPRDQAPRDLHPGVVPQRDHMMHGRPPMDIAQQRMDLREGLGSPQDRGLRDQEGRLALRRDLHIPPPPPPPTTWRRTASRPLGSRSGR